jgi:hypothetical protein
LNTYSVLSATFRDNLPNGGHLGRLPQAVVALAVLLTICLTALYAFRVYFIVATGEPAKRRGFDITRLREAGPRRRDSLMAALAGAAGATLVGIPGVNSFYVGTREIPGLTFSHFISYSSHRQQLALDLTALALAALIAVGAAAGAWWLFSGHRGGSVDSLRSRLAGAGAMLSGPTPAERVATLVPGVFIRAGETLDSFEERVLDPISTGMGESVGALSQGLTRLRGARFAVSMVAALAVIAVLLAASVLAATGHFPVTTQ